MTQTLCRSVEIFSPRQVFFSFFFPQETTTLLFCFTSFFFFVRPRLSVYVCACAPARCGLRLICCLRNTITFLLSDRVSRHTRDRARQCALETGDGARAPKPSSSFTDGEPSAPLSDHSSARFLPQPHAENFPTELGLFYSRGRGCEASVSGRVTRGSLSLARPPPLLSPSLFSNRVRDPWLDLLPDS